MWSSPDAPAENLTPLGQLGIPAGAEHHALRVHLAQQLQPMREDLRAVRADGIGQVGQVLAPGLRVVAAQPLEQVVGQGRECG
jgi:hypothetical protein